jgi:hypothetical protein
MLDCPCRRRRRRPSLSPDVPTHPLDPRRKVPGCMPSVSARSSISPWPSTASAPTANRSNPTSPVPVILAGDRPRPSRRPRPTAAPLSIQHVRTPLRTIRRRPFGRFRLLFTYTICPAFDFSPLSVDFSLLCQSLTIPFLIFSSQLFLKKSKFPFFYLYLYYYYYYYNNNKDINSKTERAAVTVPYHSRAGRSVPNSPVLTE